MNQTIYKLGFRAALIAFLAIMAFTIAQILQLLGLLSFPADQVLIFGFSLCIVIPFLLAMLAVHYTAPNDKKLWSHAALLFAVIYAVFVTANYVVQLATVIPGTLKEAAPGLDILRQSPHSLFWDFDAVGYVCMGLATLFAVPALKRKGFQKWVRYSFLAHAFVTPLIALVYFYPNFTDQLLLIGLPWAITAPASMMLLALMFKTELINVKPAKTFDLQPLEEKSKLNGKTDSKKLPMRSLLLVLLVFLGLGGIFGGGVLIIFPSGEILGMPLSMLNYSPFNNFLVPGMILFFILGVSPIGVAAALIKKPNYKFAELFNFYPDMYWGWTYCVYIAFALIGWIQIEMTFLRAVHWSHSLYIFLALAILFITLLPQVRKQYKR